MINRLLYLNLAIDTDDTSLGFATGWLKEISKNYDKVDVITLRKGSVPHISENINIYGPEASKRKFKKYFYLYKTAKYLLKVNSYEKCFSHMSPISLLVISSLLKKYNIKSILWFTHPGPSFGLKKLILYSTSKIVEQIITASNTSFPFMSNKVEVIGHAVDLSLFKKETVNFQFKNFLILSRISKSKNIEMSIDSFLDSDFKFQNLDIIGGPLNLKDKNYFNHLKEKYKEYTNINFIGKVSHANLPKILEKYDVNFNAAGEGFFDKSVLETLSIGIINFYRNPDFNSIYLKYSENFNFTDKKDLTIKINKLNTYNNDQMIEIFDGLRGELQIHSLKTLSTRLNKFL